MLDLGSFGRSTLRALGLAHGGQLHAARAGIVFGPEHATMVRMARPEHAGGAPLLQSMQRLAVESGRRVEIVRRWLHTGRLRDASAVVVLAPGEYDLMQLAAPAVPEEELRDALRWQLRGTLPYSPEEAALDFVRVPQPADAPQRPTLLVAVAPRATVTMAVAPLADIGIQIEAVDIPELAQRNLLRLDPPGVGTTSAWLGFENNACLLTVHVGTELAFARRIPVTGMSQEIETENQLAYLSERIGTQVQRSLDLVERQLGQPPATQLTLAPHRHAKRMARDIAERTGLQARVFDARAELHEAEPGAAAEEWTHEHMAALGAALRVEDAPADVPARPTWSELLGRLRRDARPAATA